MTYKLAPMRPRCLINEIVVATLQVQVLKQVKLQHLATKPSLGTLGRTAQRPTFASNNCMAAGRKASGVELGQRPEAGKEGHVAADLGEEVGAGSPRAVMKSLSTLFTSKSSAIHVPRLLGAAGVFTD